MREEEDEKVEKERGNERRQKIFTTNDRDEKATGVYVQHGHEEISEEKEREEEHSFIRLKCASSVQTREFHERLELHAQNLNQDTTRTSLSLPTSRNVLISVYLVEMCCMREKTSLSLQPVFIQQLFDPPPPLRPVFFRCPPFSLSSPTYIPLYLSMHICPCL